MEHESECDLNFNKRDQYSPKGLVHGLEDFEIRGQVETIQSTVLMISVGILRRVVET